MDGQRDSSQLWVDLAQDTGALKYGASGFLYGLGNAGIPNVAMLAPLKPQVAAQKPEGGLQHPNGDALDVAGTYQAAGGKEIEIYLQDAYPGWPYDQMGLADYLDKVEAMVRQVSASPHASLFSYVPFNEPDQIWYNKTDKNAAFFTDWQSVYQKIKAIHSSARIVGPNFARYDAPFYREFMAFAKAHACLPDVVSWHELNQDFFTGWAGRYADYPASKPPWAWRREKFALTNMAGLRATWVSRVNWCSGSRVLRKARWMPAWLIGRMPAR